MRLSSNIKIKRYTLIICSRTLLLSHAFNSGAASSATRFITAIAAAPNSREEAPKSSLVHVLRYAKTHRLLSSVKIVHAFILRSGLLVDEYLCNNLLGAYLACDAICYARHMFDRMPERDTVSWNTMISGFLAMGLFTDGFAFFRSMIRHGTPPMQPSFASILAACAELTSSTYAEQVHSFIIRFGFSSFTTVANALLKCYIKFGDYEDWLKILDEILTLDEISVQTLLRGCVQRKIFGFAVELFKYSLFVGLDVSPYTITSLVSLCLIHDHFNFGIQIHGFVQKVGLLMSVSVVNSLITMYSSSYALNDAEDLFERANSRDLVTWNSLLNGYAYNREGDSGLGFLQRLLSSGIAPNESTFLCFLSCCATISLLKNAKKAHAFILKLSQGFKEWTDNITLTMYCRSKSVEDATTFFEASEVKDCLSSNLIMGLYRSCGRYKDMINIFYVNWSQECQVDEMMLSRVIASCSRLGFLDFGCQIHGYAIKSGLDEVSYLKNSVLELYSQCGRVDDMERTFEECARVDVFSWNTMLIGYANADFPYKAFRIWEEMLKLGIKLNEFSYAALLNGCSDADFLLKGEQIHATIAKTGMRFDITLMNSLLTMYANCRRMEKARLIFEEISSPDSVSWNAMLSGYTQNGFPTESIQIYTRIDEYGIATNDMTYASILSSCSSLGNLNLGLQLHVKAIKSAFDLNLSVSNSLITMYSRCGDITDSLQIFSDTPHPDLVTWNSMIHAFAHHGLGKESIALFKWMNDSNEKPNGVTFTGILSSCSRAGLVSEACYHMSIMDEVYGVAPGEEHCACFVDTLCRAGRLREAAGFIESVPIANCSLVWKIVLSFCRLNGDVELGEVAARKIVDLEPLDSAPYVILSDLHASLGNRVAKDQIRRLMEDRGVKKETGCSWISS